MTRRSNTEPRGEHGLGHAATCSGLASTLGEPMSATAPLAPAWLLIELPTAWGPRPPTDCGWSPELASHLASVAASRGMRLQLIRRHTRPRRLDVRAPKAHLTITYDDAGPTVTAGTWSTEDDLFAEPFPGRSEAPAEGGGSEEPLLLVCTHGKRDRCCALAGREVAAAMEARFGAMVWETTHLGGHRFAANVLVLPDGTTYGRLTPASAVGVIAGHLAGTLTLENYRGNARRSAWEQAAESAIRRAHNLLAPAVLTTRMLDHEDGRATVRVDVASHGNGGRRSYVVGLRSMHLGRRRLSCGAEREDDVHTVVLDWVSDARTEDMQR